MFVFSEAIKLFARNFALYKPLMKRSTTLSSAVASFNDTNLQSKPLMLHQVVSLNVATTLLVKRLMI
jgi:hypothetical protein